MKLRTTILMAIIAIMPLTAAVSQTNNPSGPADDKKDSTATNKDSASNPNQPGATGSTVVPGDNSTVAGDRKATTETKDGGVAGGR